jgi:hypothetical protein
MVAAVVTDGGLISGVGGMFGLGPSDFGICGTGVGIILFGSN